MYGRLHQRKLKQDDYIMSCQKARRQLDSYIDEQAKRVNIDSAKKRAVLQHMDYDGFRQMVLGANIFPTKTTELQKFTKGESTEIIHNKLFLESGQVQQEKIEKLQAVEVITQVQGKSQLVCNSFRQFKKKFIQIYPKNGEFQTNDAQTLYNLVKHQDEQRIAKIFNMECEANILVKITALFQFIVSFLRENDYQGKAVKQVVFQVKFLETVLKLKTMRQFSLSILSKKQRARIVQFLNQAKSIMTPLRQEQLQGENKQINIPKNDKDNNWSESNKQTSQKKQQETLEKAMNQDERTIDEMVRILLKK